MRLADIVGASGTAIVLVVLVVVLVLVAICVGRAARRARAYHGGAPTVADLKIRLDDATRKRIAADAGLATKLTAKNNADAALVADRGIEATAQSTYDTSTEKADYDAAVADAAAADAALKLAIDAAKIADDAQVKAAAEETVADTAAAKADADHAAAVLVEDAAQKALDAAVALVRPADLAKTAAQGAYDTEKTNNPTTSKTTADDYDRARSDLMALRAATSPPASASDLTTAAGTLAATKIGVDAIPALKAYYDAVDALEVLTADADAKKKLHDDAVVALAAAALVKKDADDDLSAKRTTLGVVAANKLNADGDVGTRITDKRTASIQKSDRRRALLRSTVGTALARAKRNVVLAIRNADKADTDHTHAVTEAASAQAAEDGAAKALAAAQAAELAASYVPEEERVTEAQRAEFVQRTIAALPPVQVRAATAAEPPAAGRSAAAAPPQVVVAESLDGFRALHAPLFVIVVDQPGSTEELYRAASVATHLNLQAPPGGAADSKAAKVTASGWVYKLVPRPDGSVDRQLVSYVRSRPVYR